MIKKIQRLLGIKQTPASFPPSKGIKFTFKEPQIEEEKPEVQVPVLQARYHMVLKELDGGISIYIACKGLSHFHVFHISRQRLDLEYNSKIEDYLYDTLSTMMKAAGFDVDSTKFKEDFYDITDHEDFFPEFLYQAFSRIEFILTYLQPYFSVRERTIGTDEWKLNDTKRNLEYLTN
jgi:hypothetical protein